jgi:hypothetical protein
VTKIGGRDFRRQGDVVWKDLPGLARAEPISDVIPTSNADARVGFKSWCWGDGVDSQIFKFVLPPSIPHYKTISSGVRGRRAVTQSQLNSSIQ